MWPLKRGNKRKPPRRVNGRRAAGAAPTAWQRFRRAGGVGSLLMAAAFLIAVGAMDLWPLEPLGYRQGQYVPRDVFARVTFQVESPQRTEQLRGQAASMTPAVIALDRPLLEQIVGEVKNLPARLKPATQPAQLGEQLQKSFNIQSVQDLNTLAQYASPPQAAKYDAEIERLRARLAGMYILTGADYSRAFHGKEANEVRVRQDDATEVRTKASLVSLDNSRELEAALAAAAAGLEAKLRGHVLHFLQQTFSAGKALYRVDAVATRAAEKAAREAVPPTTEAVLADSLLVRAGRKGGLSQSELSLLAAEHAAYLRQQDQDRPWRRLGVLLGRVGVLLGVVVLLCLYVAKYQRSLAKDHWRAFSVAAVLALMLLATKAMVSTAQWNPHLSVFCILTASAILTIAFDQRFAFAVAGALAVLTAAQMRADLGMFLVLWAAAAVTVFQLREVRTRSKLLEAGAVTGGAVFGAVWAVEAASAVPVQFIVVDSAHAFAAAIAGGFLAQGILPVVERIFSVATSLTLLEWCDANKPLLKRVALDAPGTYSHSLMLGTVCEAAAESIGANGLLGRVGAYYHDIGKINKPDYFVENQAGPGSRHDKLSPAMSLLIIKGHVKDGLELARQYNLPRVLRQFIASHHGTTLVEYFYHAAARQRKEDAERAPEEVEFRYPGPKPHLKEAAILMLADVAESAVRAMSEPTPGRIETQVHQVVSKRLMDGQLDECDMTLREVHEVETSLVKSLCGLHHARVRYPSQKKEEPAEQAEAGAAEKPPAEPAEGKGPSDSPQAPEHAESKPPR